MQRDVDPLTAGINNLQEPLKTHEMVPRVKTQPWRRILTRDLPLYFPEIVCSKARLTLALIRRFTTPAGTTAFDRQGLSANAYSPIGGKVSIHGSSLTSRDSCASVTRSVPENGAATARLRMIIAQDRSLSQQRDETERFAHVYAGRICRFPFATRSSWPWRD